MHIQIRNPDSTIAPLKFNAPVFHFFALRKDCLVRSKPGQFSILIFHGEEISFSKSYSTMHLVSCHTGCRQSIAFVSSPLRTRVPKLSERVSLYLFPTYPRFLPPLLSLFLSPSIHPSIQPADSSPSFTPNREIFPYSRDEKLFPYTRSKFRRSISKISKRVFLHQRLLHYHPILPRYAR